MKRHPSLEVFSRDHNVGLVLGRRLDRASSLDNSSRKSAAEMFLRYWKEELGNHIAEEERLLIRLIPSDELKERLVAEHHELKSLVALIEEGDTTTELLARAGNRLSEHIRWEERELFPAIEHTASDFDLRELCKETERLEARRTGSAWSPRRAELLKRRGQDHPKS